MQHSALNLRRDPALHCAAGARLSSALSPGWDWPHSLAILTGALPAAAPGRVIIFAENRDGRAEGGCEMARATKSMKEF
ncbi:MAG: hypothetical protein ACRDQU_14260, partial [Pseudonocardiaceae bacterium]